MPNNKNSKKQEKENSKVIDSKSFQPNNYDIGDIGVVSKEVKLEDREEHKLKESLGM